MSKKFKPEEKLTRLDGAIEQVLNEIATGKKSAELIAIIINDLTMCLSVIRADVDDPLKIAKIWIDLERQYQQLRGLSTEATQMVLEYSPEKGYTDGKKRRVSPS